ncbi:MAG: LPS assembly lipoprotein LptE [Chlorobi bacterium]|nr:LPS assembly lipoprotein LptE [Chlorobiota bacterium]MCI0715085.1 LPS assembly lipoprotein LptE [Chlorobiota bacterium]
MAKRFKLPECFIILISAVLLGSCTYSFKGASPPEGIKTIYIPNFRDESGFGLPTLSEEMTTLLKGKFINDNTLEYAEKTNADGMLDCIIRSVKDEVQVVSGNEQVSRRKVTIVVSVDFSNLKKQKSIWKKDFSNWGEYDSSTGGFSKRDEGVKAAINKLTDDILIDVISNW